LLPHLDVDFIAFFGFFSDLAARRWQWATQSMPPCKELKAELARLGQETKGFKAEPPAGLRRSSLVRVQTGQSGA
jgi:hypothetical protein